MGDEAYLSDEYLNFLLQLCNNISEKIPELDENSFTSMQVSKESLIELSNKLLDDESSINFSNVARRGMSDCSGLTFNEYIFDKSYINVTRQNNIFDYQIFNHEIMHGIDFYMKKKVPSENIYNRLFIDYLDENGLDPNEVQILRKQKDNYLHSLATITQTQIKTQLMRKYGFKNSTNPTIEQIREILNSQLKNNY